MGYSVLLWSVPEQGLDDGELVPVLLRELARDELLIIDEAFV